jgi:hypothetical protein
VFRFRSASSASILVRAACIASNSPPRSDFTKREAIAAVRTERKPMQVDRRTDRPPPGGLCGWRYRRTKLLVRWAYRGTTSMSMFGLNLGLYVVVGE